MKDHTTFGKKGEEIAREILANKGLSIVKTNWQYKHKEIDIIAENKDFIIIVEVKTRSGPIKQNLQEIITRKKQKFLIEAANAYIKEVNSDKEIRFDVILIIYLYNKTQIEHIENAFSPQVRNY
ncbi:YraN family protein [Bacteroidota bacterium]